MTADTWQTLGTPAPTALTDARLQLHWAVQVLAAVPHNYAEPRDDDSHTNLGWEAEPGRFTVRPLGHAGVSAALRVPDLTLAVLAPDGRALEEFPLAGRTLDDAYEWMAGAVARPLGAGARSGPLRRRDYDMPDHPVGSAGAAFGTPRAGLDELARWYSNAGLVLGQVQAADARASKLRTWPHHFDMATLIVLDGDVKGGRSINAGFSPGDQSYDEPYFYVTPWPAPEGELPTLRSDGQWHTEGFVAAVLPGSRTAVGGASEQATRTERFLGAALEASRALLAAD